MSIFSGKPEEIYSDANFLTDVIELRSNCITSILAVGISLSIASLTFLPASKFLIAIIVCTPRKARTLAVSIPMPLDAPEIRPKKKLTDKPIKHHKMDDIILLSYYMVHVMVCETLRIWFGEQQLQMTHVGS